MSNVVRLPVRAATSAAAASRKLGDAAAAPMRQWWPVHSVDDWGRDQHLVRAMSPWMRMRWDVSVGGEQHVPQRVGALLVTNARRFSMSSIYAAWALGEAVGRPVRFVGRPDVAPIGSFMRRVGALLDRPDEVAGALRNGELVLMAAKATGNPRHAGDVDPALIGAAIATKTIVLPVASMSTPMGRGARVEVGPAVRAKRNRRGPLAEVEMAEATQRHIQKLLDGFGGLRTGVAPLDWLAEG